MKWSGENSVSRRSRASASGRHRSLPHHRSWRWCSSWEARASSLHLILCPSPADCWRSLPSLSGDGSLEALALSRRPMILGDVSSSSPDERRR